MSDTTTTTTALGLPKPTNQSEDIRGGEVAAALWRFRHEWKRYKRIDAQADAEPEGPRKDLLNDAVEHILVPAETSAENSLIDAIFRLNPPRPDQRYPDRGVSVVRVGDTLVVVTTDLAADGSPKDGDTEVFIVPLDAAIRVKPDLNVNFQEKPLRSPIKGPFPALKRFDFQSREGIIHFDVWVGSDAAWDARKRDPHREFDNWGFRRYDGLTVAVNAALSTTDGVILPEPLSGNRSDPLHRP
ncbi:MAG: hypothetical protein U0800_08565 [Isosphaeraceae bacterium]